MLSKVKEEGYEPLILGYYENFIKKDVPLKYHLYSNEKIKNEEMKAYFLNSFCYESFESVLSDFALIPETVFNHTFAILKDKDEKENVTKILVGEYCNYILKAIPLSAYFSGLTFVKSKDKDILVATKEKALLDYIYVSNRNFSKLNDFDEFFKNYRFDLDEFMLLDFKKIEEYGKLYKSHKIDLFLIYLKRGEFNFD